MHIHWRYKWGETGNQKTPHEQTICSRCDTEEIDNEIGLHFLINCCAFATNKSVLFSAAKTFIHNFDAMDTNDKSTVIMSTEDPFLVKARSRYEFVIIVF